MAQEALNNVAKHARAREVRMRLASAANGHVELHIRDDGCGMNPSDRQKPDSFGLAGIDERVRVLGGVLRVHGVPGSGTSVEVVVPLE